MTKNPKNVERGKKAHETHLRKMKEKILAGTTTPAATTPATPATTPATPATTPATPATTPVLLVILGFGAVAGYYVYKQSKTAKVVEQPVAKTKKKVWMDLS